MKIDYGFGEQDILVSMFTLVIYEQEFKSDMIQDLFGRTVIEEEEETNGIVLDFTRTNWTAVTKCLWAALKTYDPGFMPYKSWAATLTNINLFDLKESLIPVVMESLFRAGASFSENEEEEE